MIESINKIKLLLTKQQKLSLVYLSLLLVIGMFLEIFGLGLIIPLITIILDPELINDTYGIRQIKEYLGDINNNEFLYYSLITIILVYVIKTLFLIFLAFKQNTFLSNLYKSQFPAWGPGGGPWGRLQKIRGGPGAPRVYRFFEFTFISFVVFLLNIK